MTGRQRIIKTFRYMAIYGMFEQVYKDALTREMLDEDGHDIDLLTDQLVRTTDALKKG